MRHKFYFCLICLLLCACATVGISGRKQLMLVSNEQEESLGLQSFQEVLSTSTLSKDAKNTALVKKVGQKLANTTGENYSWEFVLIEDKTANAFCLPGGKIAVYTGILPYTKTEEGLAVVLSHEIAHAIAHHSAERLSQQQLVNIGLLAGNFALKNNKNKDLILSAFGVAGNYGVILPYSRKHEYEADYIGLVLMKRAGYNPSTALTFWKSMSQANGGSNSALAEFVSTHPSDENRIAEIKRRLQEI